MREDTQKTGERLMLIANDLLNVKAFLASRFLALRSIHKAFLSYVGALIHEGK